MLRSKSARLHPVLLALLVVFVVVLAGAYILSFHIFIFHFLSSMLARSTLGRAAPVARAAAPPNARNMATLRELETRLKSVRNIEKITKV